MSNIVLTATSLLAGSVLGFGTIVAPTGHTGLAYQDSSRATFASITCDSLLRATSARAWGTGYQPDSTIAVSETVRRDFREPRVSKFTVETSSEGAWAAPASFTQQTGHGGFSLDVIVADLAGTPLGSAHDQCNL